MVVDEQMMLNWSIPRSSLDRGRIYRTLPSEHDLSVAEERYASISHLIPRDEFRWVSPQRKLQRWRDGSVGYTSTLNPPSVSDAFGGEFISFLSVRKLIFPLSHHGSSFVPPPSSVNHKPSQTSSHVMNLQTARALNSQKFGREVVMGAR